MQRESNDSAESTRVEGDVAFVDNAAGDRLSVEGREAPNGAPDAVGDDGWPGPIDEPEPLFGA